MPGTRNKDKEALCFVSQYTVLLDDDIHTWLPLHDLLSFKGAQCSSSLERMCGEGGAVEPLGICVTTPSVCYMD